MVTGNMHRKFGEVWSWIYVHEIVQTVTQTDTHRLIHHSTLLPNQTTFNLDNSLSDVSHVFMLWLYSIVNEKAFHWSV